MIDLKRNSHKQPVKATGRRSRKTSIYSPYQKEDFRISRSKDGVKQPRKWRRCTSISTELR